MKRLVENKKTVTVLFAVDENNDVYRIARFTERVHDEEHYYWSQIGNVIRCAERKDITSLLKKEEEYIPPLSQWNLLWYFKNRNGDEYREVAEVLYRAGFKKQAKGFYMLIVRTDYNNNSDKHELYYITKSEVGAEILFKEPCCALEYPMENTEFYASAKTEDEKNPVHLRYSHEFTNKWSHWSVSDKEPILSGEFLFEKFREQGCYKTVSESFATPHKLDVVGWSFADEEHFKLTPSGIFYLTLTNPN